MNRLRDKSVSLLEVSDSLDWNGQLMNRGRAWNIMFWSWFCVHTGMELSHADMMMSCYSRRLCGGQELCQKSWPRHRERNIGFLGEWYYKAGTNGKWNMALWMLDVWRTIKCVYVLVYVHCEWQCFSWGFFVHEVVLQGLMSLADVKVMWWCKL